MGKITFNNAIYRLLDSEKPVSEFIGQVIKILQDNYNGTIWNIGYVIESTAQLEFLIKLSPFKELKTRATEIFNSGKPVLIKKEVPRGYKWLQITPMIYNKQKLGVFICFGKGKAGDYLESIGEDLAFVLQQYQLKSKLIKDTIMMNTIIMASQSTASDTEIVPLIRILYPHLKKYLEAVNIRIFIWEDEEVFYYDEFGRKNNITIPEGESIVKEVKLAGRALMIQKAYENENFNPEIDSIEAGRNVLNLIASPINISGEVKGVLLAVNNDSDRVFVGSELVWVKSVCGELGAALEKIKLYQDIRKLFLSSVEALVAAIEGKDPYTHGHSRRVTMFSMIIGQELGFEKEQIEDIRLSALLHDIGKIAVPESVLLKPTKLNDDEWYSMKQHPVMGVKMLEKVKNFEPLLPGIKHHHERYDGKGYPSGLSGEDIPLIARIINVADSFDAMTSKRIYRDALTEDEALKEVQKCKGTQFDPKIAEIFLSIYRDKFYSGNLDS